MSEYSKIPISPTQISLDLANGKLIPSGPKLIRRLSDLKGCFKNEDAWKNDVTQEDQIVYQVISSIVPESARELPQSITTIYPGNCGGELYMTKGHQHPDPQGEIYFGLEGSGGIIMFDGKQSSWIEITPGKIGYIPPGWAHRSVNTGDDAYKFLAVYPGSAGHDYQWVLNNGMGLRAFRKNNNLDLQEFYS